MLRRGGDKPLKSFVRLNLCAAGAPARDKARSRRRLSRREPAPPPASTLARFVVLALGLAHPADRHDALLGAGVEDDHALGRPPGDSDPRDWNADELPAVGHQHDFVALLHRERGDERAVAVIDRHGDDTLAAAPSDAILERRTALAVTVLGQCEDHLFGGAHRFEAIRLERARSVRRPVLVFALAIRFGLLRCFAFSRPALLEEG